IECIRCSPGIANEPKTTSARPWTRRPRLMLGVPQRVRSLAIFNLGKLGPIGSDAHQALCFDGIRLLAGLVSDPGRPLPEIGYVRHGVFLRPQPLRWV